MLFDLNALLDGELNGVEKSFSFVQNGQQISNDIAVAQANEALFTAENVHGSIQLALKAKTLIKANCVRCGDDVCKNIDTDVSYTVTKADLSDNDNELGISGGKLDLAAFALQELFLALPTQILCSDDCEGLCQICGKKLSEGCTCEKQPYDERLAVLKQLLK